MRVAALALALLATGCVTGQYRRVVHLEKLPRAAFESLEVGRSDLTEALAKLGAPSYVWELGDGHFALAWAWLETHGWGVVARVPVTDAGSANFDYDSQDSKTRGWVLQFDAEGRLLSMRKGYLRELGQELGRARPAEVED